MCFTYVSYSVLVTLRTQMTIEGQEGYIACSDPQYSHVQHVLDKYDAGLIRAQRS